MATKPRKNVRITSPAGIVKWASLAKPGLKYKSETEYDFNAQIILTKEQAQPLIDQLTEMAKQVKAEKIATAENKKEAKAIEACNLSIPIGPETDEDGEDTGNFILKVKRDATYTDKKTKETINVKIPLFDSAGKLLIGPKIGKGSKIRVAFDAVPFAMPATNRVGISGRLQGAQVLELVEFGSGNAESMGFSAEAGGYTAPEGEEEADISSPTKTSSGSGDF
jgi:hypothetical protein